jgi:hypothetical protein
MARHRRFLLLTSIFLLVGCIFGYVGRGIAAPTDMLPGSEQDPLVSKSYVDQKLGLVVVEVAAGNRLIASSGTEMILRSGQATAIDSEMGGLSDVTAGKDIRQGEAVAKNHLLIVPRDDGRGLLASTDLIVLVRGDFSIK